MTKHIIDSELLERAHSLLCSYCSTLENRAIVKQAIREISAILAQPAADCGLEVFTVPGRYLAVNRKNTGAQDVVLKSDADARDAMRLERIAELEAAITSCLPCSYYMDLPDGGRPSLEEQLRRMAKDAADLRATELRLREVASHCATVEAELAALKAQEQIGEIYDVDGVYMAIWANGTPDVGTKLYAAPVAKQEVVMPERMDEHAPTVEQYLFRQGWNECLDEIAYLNGGKPNE